MPVSTVGAGGSGNSGNDKAEIVSTGRVVELDSLGVKVDSVGNVVPDIGGPVGNVPLRDAADHPVEGVGGGFGGTGKQTRLQLGEVGLEETDLVLLGLRRGVGGRVLQGEVVVDLAGVDGSGRLGDEFGPAHGLALPVAGVVDGDLGTILAGGVGRVLVVGGNVDVSVLFAGSVDVVLVRADSVAKGPCGELSCGGGVEAAVPEDGAGKGRLCADQGGSQKSGSGWVHF